MKKIVSVLLLVCLLVGMVSMTACGKTQTKGGVYQVPEGGYDGSKVTIPDLSQAEDLRFSWYETGAGGHAGSDGKGVETLFAENASGLVDLNRATVEELMTIPGIGQSRAQAIVAYRQSHGSFGSVQEIMQVTGIKEGLFEAIRQYITVGG